MSDSSSTTRILFFDFRLSAATILTPSQTSQRPPVTLDQEPYFRIQFRDQSLNIDLQITSACWTQWNYRTDATFKARSWHKSIALNIFPAKSSDKMVYKVLQV